MTSRPRILLTHTPDMRRNYFGATALAELRSVGDVTVHEGAMALDATRLVAAAKDCQLIVADRNTPVAAVVFTSLPGLVSVSRVAVDIRNIDVEAASGAGVLITQASRSWVPAVSELVLGLMIDVARGVSRSNIAYKAGLQPSVALGRQLSGSTAGIIGYGPLGKSVAKLCLAFGMRVLVHDPYASVEQADVEQVALGELLAGSDFVLPLAVATEETENLIGNAAFAAMKPSAYLVNLSRGNLIDERALVQALDTGQIAGAALDVGRAADQMPTLAIAARPDVTATPHIGGLTAAGIEGQALEVVAQVREIAMGRAPVGSANADHATRLAGVA